MSKTRDEIRSKHNRIAENCKIEMVKGKYKRWKTGSLKRATPLSQNSLMRVPSGTLSKKLTIQSGILLCFPKFADVKALLNTVWSRKKLISTEIRHVRRVTKLSNHRKTCPISSRRLGLAWLVDQWSKRGVGQETMAQKLAGNQPYDGNFSESFFNWQGAE